MNASGDMKDEKTMPIAAGFVFDLLCRNFCAARSGPGPTPAAPDDTGTADLLFMREEEKVKRLCSVVALDNLGVERA